MFLKIGIGFNGCLNYQTMLRRTEGSSKEEQIIQKEQILAELQVIVGETLYKVVGFSHFKLNYRE